MLGWLRILSEWVGPDGEVTGTDVDDAMLAAADRFVTDEGLRNVGLVKDDLFASELEPNSFDLVHARYEITRSGALASRWRRTAASRAPAPRSCWKTPTRAPGTSIPGACARETDRAHQGGVSRERGDLDAGRQHLQLLRKFGIEGNVSAEVVALPPGHPYLRLPLQFATSLRSGCCLS